MVLFGFIYFSVVWFICGVYLDRWVERWMDEELGRTDNNVLC